MSQRKGPTPTQQKWLRHIEHSGHVRVQGVVPVHQQCIRQGWVRSRGVGTNEWELTAEGSAALCEIAEA